MIPRSTFRPPYWELVVDLNSQERNMSLARKTTLNWRYNKEKKFKLKTQQDNKVNNQINIYSQLRPIRISAAPIQIF